MGTPLDFPVVLGNSHRRSESLPTVPGSGNHHVANAPWEYLSPTHKDLSLISKGHGRSAAITNLLRHSNIPSETNPLIG